MEQIAKIAEIAEIAKIVSALRHQLVSQAQPKVR
jgi:hypothetical protein